jgi:hypothetical protein
MKTAVEWFYQRILAKDINAVFEQAKQIEKEQIINAYSKGVCNEDITAGQYYNETFKSDYDEKFYRES